MTVTLSLCEPILGEPTRPDSLGVRVRNDLDSLSLELASRGALATLSRQDCLGVAARLEWAVRDLRDLRPQIVDFKSTPYYQLEPCPPWCLVEHSDDAPRAKREHIKEDPPGMEVLRRGSLCGYVEVTTSQHFDWLRPQVHLFVSDDQNEVVLNLTVEEADRFGHLLRGVVDALSPGHVWHGLEGEGRGKDPYSWWLDNSDPADWPMEERTPPDPLTRRRIDAADARRSAQSLRRCPNSGGLGIMIEIPGMDDWKVRCPECGTTWGGGATSPLDQHDRP